jgi:nucleoside-diphosphate-sugar epimerase
MAAKRYLVTGGTGFIGAALTRALVEAGHTVRTLDNSSRGSHERLRAIEGQYDHEEGDVRDYLTVERAARSVDAVCHLAFINGTEHFYAQPEDVLDVGVKGMVNVVDACKKLDIPELIVASSSEVYHNPERVPTDETVPLVIPDVHNPRYSYACGKILSEVMAINCGKKFFQRSIIFRPHNVYGPDMGWEHVIPQFALRMRELCGANSSGAIRFPVQGDGSQTRAFCFIEDAIQALMLVLNKGSHLEIYNIGTDREVSIASVAHMVARHFRREIEIEPGKPAEGATPRRCPDISKITALGFKPQVALEAGIEVTACWYDANSCKAPRKSFVST